MVALKISALCAVLLFAGIHSAAIDPLELYDTLKEVVGEAVKHAVSQVESLNTEFATSAELTADTAKAEFLEGVEIYVAHIDELEKKAEEASANIEECVGESRDEIRKLADTYHEKVATCLDQKKRQVSENLEDIVENIRASEEQVDAIGEHLEACRHDPNTEVVDCLAHVEIDITKELENIPVQINQDLEEAIAYIAGVQPTLQKCSSYKYTHLKTDASRIVAGVTNCANQIIHRERTN